MTWIPVIRESIVILMNFGFDEEIKFLSISWEIYLKSNDEPNSELKIFIELCRMYVT